MDAMTDALPTPRILGEVLSRDVLEQRFMVLDRRGADPLEYLRAAGRMCRTRLRDGSEVECVRKQIGGAVRGFDPESGALTLVASDNSVDRYRDIISQDGWVFENFARNPVILNDHFYFVDFIVGQATAFRVQKLEGEPAVIWTRPPNSKERTKVKIKPAALMLDIQMDPPDASTQTRVARAKLATKSLRANSVGFIPLRWSYIVTEDNEWTGGFYFEQQELLEDSLVAVPANPNALTIEDAASPPTPRALEPAGSELQDSVDSLELRLAAAALSARL